AFTGGDIDRVTAPGKREEGKTAGITFQQDRQRVDEALWRHPLLMKHRLLRFCERYEVMKRMNLADLLKKRSRERRIERRKLLQEQLRIMRVVVIEMQAADLVGWHTLPEQTGLRAAD